MAAKTFTVSHGKIRIKVRLLPTVADVHQAYRSAPGKRAQRGKVVHAFFNEMLSGKYLGTVFLAEKSRLAELVPHEVSHASVLLHGGVLPKDDEDHCTTVGILCARIFKRLAQMGVAV
jgi:hypothetical protein